MGIWKRKIYRLSIICLCFWKMKALAELDLPSATVDRLPEGTFPALHVGNNGSRV